jgi:hypothetical protein
MIPGSATVNVIKRACPRETGVRRPAYSGKVPQPLTPRDTCKNVAISVERQSIKSVILRSVGYDAASKVLEIEFTSGMVYRFTAVPEKVWSGLMHSTEAGKYFSEKIRPKFQSHQVAG